MTTHTESTQVAAQTGLPARQVAATIALLDAGNTLPFIARYRKEQTGALDEEQLRAISDTLASVRALEERRTAILATLEEQGTLTPELRAAFAAATTRTALEDLYQPYRPKRRTRAGIAREKGLQPLAERILQQPRDGTSAQQTAAAFVNEQVPTAEDALAGARDIIAEIVSDTPGVRSATREKARQWATLRASRGSTDDPKGTFQTYYEFAGSVARLKPYQILALNRGEREGVLHLALDVPERDWRTAIAAHYRPDNRSPLAEQLALAIDDAASRLLLPAVERDVRRMLTEDAETHAIGVFAQNLRGLLLQPPLAGNTVLGIDPGFRTGCKVAVVDAQGAILATDTLYFHLGERQHTEATRLLEGLIARHHVTLLVIGNGTASRETEQTVAGVIKRLATAERPLHYLIVNEAGASVYSASPQARAELPQLDVTLRGAVSIARRAQDPLAELVKIDPQAIGVGLYQHDVDQKQLASALDGVVERVVNEVGVDVNTASAALLTHVAGIGPKLAEKIVAHRTTTGPFPTRASLRKVSGLGAKAFEQSAGFLRVRDGEQPLDASAIHPESYPVAVALLKRARIGPATPSTERAAALDALVSSEGVPALATALGTGEPTLRDILEQLVRPGRDPRADLPAPLLRADVLSMSDLQPGLRLAGTVRNVVDFGAFIDIGVKQDGLLHRSQMPRGTVLHVGDVLTVEIISVEAGRGRIALGLAND